MLTSLRFRLWLTYAVIVFLVIGIALSAVVVYILRNPASDRRELQRLRLVSALVLQRNQIANLSLPDLQSNRLEEAVRRIDQALGARLAIFSADGRLLVDSRQNQAAGLPDWSFFSQNLPRSQRLIERISIYRDTGGLAWLYHIAPVEGGFYLLVSTPRARVPLFLILREEILTPFTQGILLALVLSLLLAFWMARWITEPLQKISAATFAVSRGEFAQIPLQGPQEVKQLARTFNEMSEQVQASRRSQRDFIANISHDLKTPLTSIQGFAQAILDDTASNMLDIKQSAGVILNESERMVRMVQDLLELARLDSGVTAMDNAPVDLVALLRRVQEQFSPLAKKLGVVLNLTEPRVNQPMQVRGDAERLGQVFSNLTDNALKYSPAGSTVELAIHSSAGWVEVSVADQGPGIPEAELGRIFERFYQIDKSRSSGSQRGVGLGLAIAREIVLLHHGTITAHNLSTSPPGANDKAGGSGAPGGSIFIVRLPQEIQPNQPGKTRMDLAG